MAKKKKVTPIAAPKKMGAPVTYKQEYGEIVKRSMAQGFTLDATAGEIGVSRETVYQWKSTYPEFSDAISLGNSLSRKWWENVGRSGIIGHTPKFSASAWIFVMKNLFKWQDSSQVEVLSDPRNSDAVNAQLTTLSQRFEELLTLEKEKQGDSGHDRGQIES